MRLWTIGLIPELVAGCLGGSNRLLHLLLEITEAKAGASFSLGGYSIKDGTYLAMICAGSCGPDIAQRT